MKNRPVNIEGEKCPHAGCLYAIVADSVYRFRQVSSVETKVLFAKQLPNMLARVRREAPLPCPILFCINRRIVAAEQQAGAAIGERKRELEVGILDLLSEKHSIEQGEWDHDR